MAPSSTTPRCLKIPPPRVCSRAFCNCSRPRSQIPIAGLRTCLCRPNARETGSFQLMLILGATRCPPNRVCPNPGAMNLYSDVDAAGFPCHVKRPGAMSRTPESLIVLEAADNLRPKRQPHFGCRILRFRAHKRVSKTNELDLLRPAGGGEQRTDGSPNSRPPAEVPVRNG